MKFASVILDIPVQALDSAYTYQVPSDMIEVEIGCAVAVPFGSRQAVGYVIALFSEEGFDSKAIDPAKIKPIARVLSGSYFDESAAACALYISESYIAPLSSCVRLFTPPAAVPRMVRAGSYWKVEQPKIGPVNDQWVRLGPAATSFKPRANAIKQKRILAVLEQGELRVSELALEFGAVHGVLKTLAEKDVVVLEARRRVRGSQNGSEKPDPIWKTESVRRLTEEQASALGTIQEALDRARGDTIVLDGVTGSGKTEVYLQAIQQTLAEGNTAIVLVPEISLTPQTVARFRGRFGDLVAVLHSRMGDGERFDQWQRIQEGEAKVVVGARSALFAPVKSLGLIVIDEEHESSYKQESAPRYVSRDVALWMVTHHKATLVLGSATPSIETLHRCKDTSNWHHVVLSKRVNGKPMPVIEVVDMASEFGGGHRSMFSRVLTQALLEVIEAKQKAVLLLNQRGFAQFLLCRSCGYVPMCSSCDTSLTYHEKGQQLVCHHCGYKMPTPPLCPECASPYLKKFGAGTQRVEGELEQVLAGSGSRIVRMDADTTSYKGAHERLLEEFAQPGSAVLLGTQMIAKGLDFDDVTLVGVINADTMLNLPDFRSGERTFNLIEQVAGRAGRADLPGRVMVQTYWADSVAIRSAANYDRESFLKEELTKRKILKYPPYTRLANVLIWGKNLDEVSKEATALSTEIETRVHDHAGEGWSSLPANPCVISKVRNSYRWHILVRAPEGANLGELLMPVFRNRKANKNVTVTVDIDPYDLL